MKLLYVTILLSSLFVILQPKILAAEIPTPTPRVTFTNQFTTDNEPNISVAILKNFVHGFDSILGGFIFYTPDPFSNTLVLQDKSEIPGVTKYRNMFYEIAIPLLAIVIAGIAVTKIGSDNIHELKSFAVKLLITVVLFILCGGNSVGRMPPCQGGCHRFDPDPPLFNFSIY